MEAAGDNNKFILWWIKIFLCLIPLGICGFTIYWTILVSQPVFLKSIGAGNVIIGALIIISTLLSGIFIWIASQKFEIDYSSVVFSIYFISTFLGLFFCCIALIMTSTETQGVDDLLIKNYLLSNSDSATESYYKSFSDAYKQTLYLFAFGQNSYEVYLILTALWFISIITFFMIYELYFVK